LRSTSQLRRRSCFASQFIKLLDPRINVNVVTAHAIFNNRRPPLLVPAHGD
jgi:hypothetical protein